MGAQQPQEAGLRIGHVIDRFLSGFLAATPALPNRKKRILRRMAQCRTGQLGSLIRGCSAGCHTEEMPLGCGDRHCPSCQASHSRQWLARQSAYLLPVPYYHAVFTLPGELRSLVLCNQRLLYQLLFDCASQTLLTFFQNAFGGTPGITAILHTWGQKLDYHPHLHCIVTGGGFSRDHSTWRSPRQRGWLLPVKAMAVVFRAKFQQGLKALEPQLRFPKALEAAGSGAFSKLVGRLYDIRWNVYLKRPFGGPQQTLAYLANYTHRVAIGNRRILSLDQEHGTVSLRYRDYSDQKVKTLVLRGEELLRRFTQHILPKGFTKIRHYGILANHRKGELIPKIRLLLDCAATRRILLALHTSLTPLPPICSQCASVMRSVGILFPNGNFHRFRPRILDTS